MERINWICGSCTYVNLHRKSTCEMCYTRRIAELTAASGFRCNDPDCHSTDAMSDKLCLVCEMTLAESNEDYLHDCSLPTQVNQAAPGPVRISENLSWLATKTVTRKLFLPWPVLSCALEMSLFCSSLQSSDCFHWFIWLLLRNRTKVSIFLSNWLIF